VVERIRLGCREAVLGEDGFTMMELLLVMMILLILCAIALPAYLQYEDSAYQASAASNARGTAVAAELYSADNYPGSKQDPDGSSSDTGYSGMTKNELYAYDASLAPGAYVNNAGADAPGVTARAPLDGTHFCVYALSGRWYAYQLNPTGPIMATTSPSAVCT
jgi:prepilin-type N-terminal cleavage/methylation domain-containing protein